MASTRIRRIRDARLSDRLNPGTSPDVVADHHGLLKNGNPHRQMVIVCY
jgi:hypothetical protein